MTNGYLQSLILNAQTPAEKCPNPRPFEEPFRYTVRGFGGREKESWSCDGFVEAQIQR